ncbi:hypothetical protein [Methylomonas sp. 11b]|uniref:hypothetical protein n=1 Tax=Methylomonas sp. 11b TaxID=1168169 RepID=UPI0012DD975F|nr:hypothetical protein [Methylomonas sp. 11b]
MKPLFTILLLIIASGCAKTSTIQPISASESEFDGAVFGGDYAQISQPTPGAEQYRIFHRAATGFISVQTVRESAEKRATEFCVRKQRRLNTLNETTSTPPHILGNFPRIELVFECL